MRLNTAVLAMFLFCAGCFTIPLGRKQINPNLFQDEKEFRNCMAALENLNGEPMDTALKSIHVPRELTLRELPAVIPTLLHPGTLFQPQNMQELKNYEDKLAALDVYSFQFQDVVSDMEIALQKFNVVFDNDGFSHKVFIVVDKTNSNSIQRVVVALVPTHTRDKVYLWQVGIDFMGGAIPQLGKDAVSALGF